MTAKIDAAALAAAYARGRSSADLLSSTTDELNAKIAEAEAALSALRLGVSGSVKFGSFFPDPGTPLEVEQHLAFGKVDKIWRLTYDSGLTHDDEQWSSMPLANAPRDIRLEAIDYLPSLLVRMVSNAEAETARVKNKLGELDAFVQATRKLGKEQ